MKKNNLNKIKTCSIKQKLPNELLLDEIPVIYVYWEDWAKSQTLWDPRRIGLVRSRVIYFPFLFGESLNSFFILLIHISSVNLPKSSYISQPHGLYSVVWEIKLSLFLWSSMFTPLPFHYIAFIFQFCFCHIHFSIFYSFLL